MATLVQLTTALALCALQVLAFQPGQGIQQLEPISPRTGFILNWDLLDWREAFRACRVYNWTLAFPSTPEEGDNLLRFLVNLSDNSTKDIHLGFHSLFYPGNYIDMQGRDMDKVGFWQWDPKSENRTDQRCGALTVDGMKTIDCSTKMESVCQFKESEDFDKIGDFGYYKLFDDSSWPLNWTDAVEECFKYNANLLVLRSPEEYDAIFAYYSGPGFIVDSLDVFYGAHQKFGDNWFLTLADEPIEDTGYDVWLPGEPADVPASDFPYVGLRLTDAQVPEAIHGMLVVPSGQPMAYICKRELH